MKKVLIISLFLSSFSYGFAQDSSMVSTINELNKLFRDYSPFSVSLSGEGAAKSTNNISVSFEKPYVVVNYSAYPLKYVLKIDFLNTRIEQEYSSVSFIIPSGIEATILNEKGSRQSLPSHWKLYGGTNPLNTRIFNGFILLQKQIIQNGLGGVAPHPFDDISLKDKGTTPTSLNKHSNVHIVKKGESLWSIAQLYDDISFYDLIQINGFTKNTKISVGDTLALREKITKISESKPSNQTKNIQTDNNVWKKLNIKDVGTIEVPPTMEKQASQSTSMKLVIVAKEFNKATTSNKKYATISVETTLGKLGEYYNLFFDIAKYGKSEISNINQNFKSHYQSNLAGALKLIEWYPLKIEKINGMSCVHISYKRQLNKEPYVIVHIYEFHNRDRVHTLTISYRESEKDYWKNDLDKALKSFKITNIK